MTRGDRGNDFTHDLLPLMPGLLREARPTFPAGPEGPALRSCRG